MVSQVRRNFHSGDAHEKALQTKNLYLRTPHALHVVVDVKCICSEAVDVQGQRHLRPCPRSLGQTSRLKNGYGRQPASWRPESSPVANFVRHMLGSCQLVGKLGAPCQDCELCWTTGPNIHAAHGKAFRTIKSVGADPSCSQCCCRRTVSLRSCVSSRSKAS